MNPFREKFFAHSRRNIRTYTSPFTRDTRRLVQDLSVSVVPGRNTRAQADDSMERYACGDLSAFSDLYEALAPALYRYLL